MSTPPWLPVRWSPPLAPDFPSLFGRYEKVVQIAWRHALGHELDEWQVWLLRSMTEQFPAGHERAGQLRWRTVLVSVSRQNGKTELAAALGIVLLLARRDALIIGIASSADQARLVYGRSMKVIERNTALAGRFEALTDTRGIRAKNGSSWEIKASKSAALNGPPIDLGIVDEVHLVKSALWSDLVNGTGSRPNTLVAGITTAGDEDSELLKRLYEDAEKGDEGARFGFWIWEAPEARIPEDDETLLAYLKAANPALAGGRIDPQIAIADVRGMPPQDAIRYRLNRFVSATSSFIEPALWQACARPDGDAWPEGRPVFAIDRTPDWSHACVTANVMDADGVVHTVVVASVTKPSIDYLETVCVALAAHAPGNFAMDRYQVGELAKRLKERGLPVQVLTQADIVSASSRFYALVVQRKLRHACDPLLTMQVPATARKNVGSGFRIARSGSGEIDAVMATAMGAYVAETVAPVVDQLFV